MLAPSDVVVDKTMKKAYVVDRYARCAFKFSNITVGVRSANQVVHSFELGQNYPNPFNPSTLISFTLSKPSHIKLVVSDLLGREVKVLADGYAGSGKHVEVFNGANNPTGVYFYTLITPSAKITKKMFLIK
jgi:hypothetical protein